MIRESHSMNALPQCKPVLADAYERMRKSGSTPNLRKSQELGPLGRDVERPSNWR
jgi:hypothetical protein